MNPFNFINSINSTKKDLIKEDPSLEKAYNPFIANRALSYFTDTIMHANKMNSLSHIDNALQYSYLINIIRPAKRFSKWAKKVDDPNLEVVKLYYGYNDKNAKIALSLLSKKQLQIIKEKMEYGGKK